MTGGGHHAPKPPNPDQPPRNGNTGYIGRHRRIPPILWQLGNRTQRPHSATGWDNGR